MKKLALWLYGLAFLLSMIIGPMAFPFLAFFITVFLGLVAVFDILFTGIRRHRHQVREHNEHHRWIL